MIKISRYSSYLKYQAAALLCLDIGHVVLNASFSDAYIISEDMNNSQYVIA